MGLLTVLGGIATGRIRFEYDFRNLRGRNVSTTIRYGDSLGRSSSSSVALVDTVEAAHALTRKLERLIASDTEGESTLKQVASLFTFVPDHQKEKLALLDDLHGAVKTALGSATLNPDLRAPLEEVAEWSAVGEVRVDILPQWVKNQFKEVDGTLGRIVYVYPRTDEWDVRSVARFYRDFGSIDVEGYGTVRLTASGFIFVEVVEAAKRDGLTVSIAAVVLVFLILLIDFRSWRRALFVFAPLMVGLMWSALAMALLDIRIGLYNLLVIPTMVGIGIDASVHLYHAYLERGQGSLRQVMRVNGGAVLVSSLTTAVGFFGSMMTTHNGLRSIGVLALLGISLSTAAALITTPLLLSFKERYRTAVDQNLGKLEEKAIQ